MLIEEIFYSIFWISAVSIIWFYTDWFIHYSQLLGIAEDLRLQYSSFVKQNADKYFPDFLFLRSLQTDNRYVKFLYKLVSCPFCSTAWLSFAVSLYFLSIVDAAPIYIFSLWIILQIKKML